MAKASKKKAGKTTKKVKPAKKRGGKVVHLITEWARRIYGEPKNQCEAGNKVYNKVLALENSGLSPDEIVALFKKRDRGSYDEFLEGPIDDLRCTREDNMSDIEDLQHALNDLDITLAGGESKTYVAAQKAFGVALATFQKAVSAEITGIENYEPRIGFVRKGGEVQLVDLNQE